MAGTLRARGFGRISAIALLAIALLAPTMSLAFPYGSVARQPEGLSPGTGQSGYAQLLIDPLVVGYTREFLATHEMRDHRIGGQDLERIRRHYQEIVAVKLAEAYPIASLPGPGVIRVEAVLIDHVLDKRGWLATSVTFQSAPRIKLVAILRDSETGRLVDTVGLLLRPRANRLMKDSPGFYWDYMRKAFDRIATRIHWRLERSPLAARD